MLLGTSHCSCLEHCFLLRVVKVAQLVATGDNVVTPIVLFRTKTHDTSGQCFSHVSPLTSTKERRIQCVCVCVCV